MTFSWLEKNHASFLRAYAPCVILENVVSLANKARFHPKKENVLPNRATGKQLFWKDDWTKKDNYIYVYVLDASRLDEPGIRGIELSSYTTAMAFFKRMIKNMPHMWNNYCRLQYVVC